VTLVFAWLGLRGAAAQRRSDGAVWWLFLTLLLVTGLGLVGYMNFRPGFARWYEIWPQPGDHEVRERDYFFVVSFIVWGIWAGMGLAAVARAAMGRVGLAARIAPAVMLFAAVPIAFNWSAASRRHGADARLAGDFAYDLLNSAPPYGILFTYGDNDTFPLWWAQEVEGIRPDVTVLCLALANTDWYMRQLRDAPVRLLDAATLPGVWRDRVIPRPDRPVHSLDDSEIGTAMAGYYVRDSQEVSLGPVTRTIAAGTVLYPNDILTLAVIRQNLGRRPIVWAATAGRSFAGLGAHVVQRGLGFELVPGRDTASSALEHRGPAGVPLDVPTTERLAFETYRYAGLLEQGAGGLESTSASIAATLSLPAVSLVYAYEARGDRTRMKRALDLAVSLSANPDLRPALEALLDSDLGDPLPSPAQGAGPLQESLNLK